MTGRQILNGVFLVNECVHSRNKDNLPGLICKLNREKAYDSIISLEEWVLARNGGDGQACVSSACFSVLISGSPKGPGLRARTPFISFPLQYSS